MRPAVLTYSGEFYLGIEAEQQVVTAISADVIATAVGVGVEWMRIAGVATG